MRGLIRRGLRLELVAAMGIALAVPTVAFAAGSEQGPGTQGLATHGMGTETTLAVETHDRAGRTTANVSVGVTGEDRLPAVGAVTIRDNGRPLAGAALNKQGQATLTLELPAGDHALTASYAGDTAHAASVSDAVRARAEASSIPDFQISVAPATLSLTAGGSGTITASITPENASGLTAPMFVTLSCSGLPDQSSCVFTPENIQILPNATAALTSSMVILTQMQEGSIARPGTAHSNSVALAVLLPGALSLGGLAWAVRRRQWLARLSLLGLLALVATLGTTACNARYNYYNHGPPPNPATPSGTYTVDVTAQSSDGVSATTHTTTLALTVK